MDLKRFYNGEKIKIYGHGYTPTFFYYHNGAIYFKNYHIGEYEHPTIKTEYDLLKHINNMINEKFTVKYI